jgi:serine/threonine protein kinase
MLLDRLGEGGMGTVYAAFDPRLDRRIAIELLRDPAQGASPRRRRLEREAQAMARLQHPHTITVHDVGEHEGQLYLAMELIDGHTLPRRRAHRTVPRSPRRIAGFHADLDLAMPRFVDDLDLGVPLDALAREVL